MKNIKKQHIRTCGCVVFLTSVETPHKLDQGVNGYMDGCSGSQLLFAAAAAASTLAEGKKAQELEHLAAFFTVLADNLALLAVCAEDV